MGAPIAVSCQLTVRDLYFFSLTTLRRRLWWFALLMGALIVYLAYNIATTHVAWNAQAVAAVLFFFLFIPYSFFVSPYISAKKRIRTDPRLGSPIVYSFSPTNVEICSSTGDANLNWTAFLEALETRSHFFLYPQAQVAYVLPKRCFAGASEIGELRSLLRSAIPKAKLRSS